MTKSSEVSSGSGTSSARASMASGATERERSSMLLGMSGGHGGHCEVDGTTRRHGSLQGPPEGGAVHAVGLHGEVLTRPVRQPLRCNLQLGLQAFDHLRIHVSQQSEHFAWVCKHLVNRKAQREADAAGRDRVKETARARRVSSWNEAEDTFPHGDVRNVRCELVAVLHLPPVSQLVDVLDVQIAVRTASLRLVRRRNGQDVSPSGYEFAACQVGVPAELHQRRPRAIRPAGDALMDTTAVERRVRHGDGVAIVKRPAAPGLDSPFVVAIKIGHAARYIEEERVLRDYYGTTRQQQLAQWASEGRCHVPMRDGHRKSPARRAATMPQL
eukprot:scaffold8656_cov69-Phaeocystis_antarctica.AAC.4